MQMTALSSKETQYGNNPKAGQYIQADDAKIYYEVYGKGKPIVVLHGAFLVLLTKCISSLIVLEKPIL